eukprot:Selendium_serpulae@DN6288_c0_g2_i13.p1
MYSSCNSGTADEDDPDDQGATGCPPNIERARSSADSSRSTSTAVLTSQPRYHYGDSLRMGHRARMTDDQKREKVDQYINELVKSINGIFTGGAGDLSFEWLYRVVYHLITQLKHGSTTYEKIAKSFEDQADTVTSEILASRDLLATTHQCWSRYKLGVDLTADVCLYMNNSFRPTPEVLRLFEVGRHIFRIRVIEHPEIRHRLTRCLLANVEES